MAQTPTQAVEQLCVNLEDSGIDYALTGPAGASFIAPFVTAFPVTDIWVAATIAPNPICDAAQAEQVPTGHNVAFLQQKNDPALAFHQRINNRWLVNPFRLYLDLR